MLQTTFCHTSKLISNTLKTNRFVVQDLIDSIHFCSTPPSHKAYMCLRRRKSQLTKDALGVTLRRGVMVIKLERTYTKLHIVA